MSTENALGDVLARDLITFTAGGAAIVRKCPVNATGNEVATVDWVRSHQPGYMFEIGMWLGDRNNIPPGCLPLDGQKVDETIFTTVRADLTERGFQIVSEADWQADPLKRGLWSSGDEGWLRLPDWNGVQDKSIGGLYAAGDLGGTRRGNVVDDAFQGHWHDGNTGDTKAGYGTPTPNSACPGPVAGWGDSNRVGGWNPQSDGTNGIPRTADETRPKTVYGTWIIRLYHSLVNPTNIDVDKLLQEYVQLNTNVTALSTTVADAKTTADAASTAASVAQTTADTASTTASAAKTAADTANTTAATAQTTADTAKKSADTANATAATTKTAADTASSTATNAKSAAEDATAAAAKAQTSATAAKTTANAATTTAMNAATSAYGYKQSFVDVTKQRSAGETYKNDTNQPIEVIVYVTLSKTGVYVSLTVDGTEKVRTYSQVAYNAVVISTLVPSKSSYSFSCNDPNSITGYTVTEYRAN